MSELTKTREEQDYAVRHLREAGPDAIPFLVDALSRPDLSAGDRRLIVYNMGRLDRPVIPPLAAVLDGPDSTLAVSAATAMGMIGDKEAIPFLTFAAASAETAPAVRVAAQEAVARLSGQPFAAQPRTPIQVLTDAAWRYHRHQVEFLEEPVAIWKWDDSRKGPVAQFVPRADAEYTLGLQLAKQALRLDPINRQGLVVQTSLTLERAIRAPGSTHCPAVRPRVSPRPRQPDHRSLPRCSKQRLLMVRLTWPL